MADPWMQMAFPLRLSRFCLWMAFRTILRSAWTLLCGWYSVRASGYVRTRHRIPNLNSNQLQVASLRVDGLDLAIGQFVEVRTTHPPDPQKQSLPKSHIFRRSNLDARPALACTVPGKTKPVCARASRSGLSPTIEYLPIRRVGRIALCVYLDVWERHIIASEDDSIRPRCAWRTRHGNTRKDCFGK